LRAVSVAFFCQSWSLSVITLVFIGVM
jgi:hypothetical protein